MLQQEVRILEADRSRLLREVAMKTELESGYAKRGAKQSVAIKDAQSKITSLDQSMQQVWVEGGESGVAVREWLVGQGMGKEPPWASLSSFPLRWQHTWSRQPVVPL